MAAPGPFGDEELMDDVERLLLGGDPVLTRGQVAERVGVPLELAQQLWHSLGFPHTGDHEVVFTEADVQALEQTVALIDAGVLDESSQTALVRSWGRSFARLAEWQAALLAEGVAGSRQPSDDLRALAGDVVPLVDSLQSYIWRRHLLSATGRLMLRPGGASQTLGVGFCDIVGYTSRSKNLDRAELVDLVETFEDAASSTITDHGAQLIKTIGDAVLFTTPDPVALARIGLELVERDSSDPRFPEVRVGLAFGEVLSRLGDVFGPTVNIAARLTSIARPGRVLLDARLAEQLEAEQVTGELRLRRLRRTAVKGYSRLEPWRLKRAKPDAVGGSAG